MSVSGAKVLNEGRFRALRLALILMAVAFLGGTAALLQRPGANPLEWIAFVLGALLCIGCYPLVHKAYREGDQCQLVRITQVIVLLGVLLMLQRIAWGLLGPAFLLPGRDVFRPTFAFLPFIYLGTFAVLPARLAVRMSWIILGLFTALTLPLLYYRTGLTLHRDGEIMLVVWLLVANPLFILILNVVPNYADELARADADLTAMRDKSALNAQLVESEQRFDLVVDSLQVGVWDWWLNGNRERWWSAKYLRLLGYTADELPRNSDTVRELMHPDDRDVAKSETLRQLKIGDTMTLYYRMRTKDRGYRWFHSQAKATRNAAGEVIRITGAIADIHDQRIAEEALHKLKDELSRMAYSDPLTRLSNRRGFDDRLKRECERARANHHPLSLLLLDLDHFKLYNDHYGHVAGDECLRVLAASLETHATEPGDFTARIGGEEFAMLLPELSADGAVQMARQVIAVLEQRNLKHEAAPLGRLSISIGVSTLDGTGLTPEALYAQADKALYAAKHRGRNTTCHVREL